jgi:hypothetical protein
LEIVEKPFITELYCGVTSRKIKTQGECVAYFTTAPPEERT